MERGVRGGLGGHAVVDYRREAEHADSVLDLRLRAAVWGACGAGLDRVPEEEPAEDGVGVED